MLNVQNETLEGIKNRDTSYPALISWPSYSQSPTLRGIVSHPELNFKVFTRLKPEKEKINMHFFPIAIQGQHEDLIE